MPRTGENIYKRKDGRWEGRYIRERVDGKAKYGAVYARSYEEVKRRLEEAKGETRKMQLSTARTGKMEDIGKGWLSDAAMSLKESSVNKYEDILRCYILPEFGESELSEITNQKIINFANDLLLNGGIKGQGLAASTVTQILSAMNGIRVYAMKKDYVVAFSTECIRLKKSQLNIRVFSLEEEGRLLAYLQDNMTLPALGIIICLFTGIRLGELCAMKWDDISIPEKKMSVSRTMQRLRCTTASDHKTEVKILEPKSISSIRIIPLPDTIMELLEASYIPGAFVLTGKSSHFVEPRTMQNHFKRIITACCIENANFHATRHTFATRCIELGFDVKSLSEILGHASIAITMNRYVHPSMMLKRENMNRFSGLFTVR